MKYYPLPKKDDSASDVILAGGNFPAGEVALALLNGAARVVCCDGAVNEFAARGGVPFAVVGDMDSVEAALRDRFADRLFRVTEQETSDLNKAVSFCIGRGMRRLTVLGATGMREDHTLAAVGVLAEYSDRCVIDMVTDYGVFDVVGCDACFESFAGQQVSLFTLSDTTSIIVEGLRYDPPGGHLRGLWQGLSNEAVDNRFCLHTRDTVIVFRNFRLQ